MEKKSSPKEKMSLSQRALLSERKKKFDPNATSDDCIEDLRAVQERYPDMFISRNWYRVHGTYSDMTWNRHMGTFTEFRRQAGLELSRHQHQLERHIAKHAALDVYREFYKKEILPWCGKYEKSETPGMKTLLVASDFHDKNSDEFVLSVFLDTAKRLQPDLIILNGDVFDLAEFSRFDKDPRRMDLRSSFDFVSSRILAPLRQACPNAQIDFIIGNHELRIFKHLADRSQYMMPLLELHGITLSQLLGLDEHGINLVSKFDFSAYKPKEIREEIRKNHKKYYGCLCITHEPEDYGMCSISGHTHKPQYIAKVNELTGSYFNLTLGSIATPDLDYVQGLNRYVQSFAIIHVDPELKEVIPEHIVFSQNYAVVGGIIYRRNRN